MITFPTTVEMFIAYQESGISRSLDDFEREFAAEVVGLANTSYEVGIADKENTLTLQSVREFFKERDKSLNGNMLRVWEGICWWCDEAYRQGKNIAHLDPEAGEAPII